MNYFFQKSLFGLALAAIITGCGTDVSDLDDDAEPGSADFSIFVAVGDSLTAGYADQALYRHGQVNSYPAILAQQFALAGGGAFSQPLIPGMDTGSLTLNSIPIVTTDRLLLAPTGDPDRPAAPAPITPASPTDVVLSSRDFTPPLNNMGVTGAKSYHLVAPNYGDPAGVGGGSANPYFVWAASSPTTTVIADAAAQTPTFFVLWIGNNDVLSYATSGGVGVQGVGLPPYGSNDITDPAVFPAIYNDILNGGPTNPTPLNTPTNKGVLVNIPDVTTIPYFTTVPHNAIPLDAATAATLNGLFQAYNDGVNALVGGPIDADEAACRQINFVAGQNRILILDDGLTDLSGFGLQDWRQATPSDFIVLPAASKLGTEQIPGNPTTVWGVSNPLLDQDVLASDGNCMTPADDEVSIVENARTQFNAAIKAAADADPNLAFFDVAALLDELNTTGVLYGSGGISSTFAQGGAFSLDGVHPTARGYAVVANEMMQVIENAFGAKLPPVNPGDYSTVFSQ